MRLKLIPGLMATACLSLGLCGVSAQTLPNTKIPRPPLPPGLVYAEDGKIKEVPIARIARKTPQQKEEALIANSPAPGSTINEPAGAVLPAKKSAKALAPQP